jgi:hypothetical protein
MTASVVIGSRVGALLMRILYLISFTSRCTSPRVRGEVGEQK